MFTEDWEQVDNLGNIRRLAMVADSYPTESTHDASNGVVEGMVVRFADKMASLGIDINGNGRHGVQCSVRCGVSVPRISQDLLAWLPLNAERRWIVWLEDANGLVYKIGDVDDGCKLSLTMAVKETNGYEMTWDWTGGVVPEGCLGDFNNIIMGVGKIDLRKYKQKDIIVVKGDSFSVDFEFEVAAGMLEDLTGNTFTCVILPLAPTGAAPLANLSIGNGFMLQAANTKLVLSRTAAQTSMWPTGEYAYTIKRVWPDQSLDTIFKGKWVVE